MTSLSKASKAILLTVKLTQCNGMLSPSVSDLAPFSPALPHPQMKRDGLFWNLFWKSTDSHPFELRKKKKRKRKRSCCTAKNRLLKESCFPPSLKPEVASPARASWSRCSTHWGRQNGEDSCSVGPGWWEYAYTVCWTQLEICPQGHICRPHKQMISTQCLSSLRQAVFKLHVI